MTDRKQNAFTLIELLIVVTLLGILAVIVIPQYSNASDDAKLSRLAADLRAVRVAIEFYKAQHAGRAPHYDLNGVLDKDTDHFFDRLLSKTDASGKIIKTGAYGPYLRRFPSNPFASDPAKADEVELSVKSAPDGTKGWLYNINTGEFFANTAEHKDM